MQAVKQAVRNLAVQLDQLNKQIHNAPIVINDAEVAVTLFEGVAKKAAHEVMAQVLREQQEQINTLAESVVQLTGLVQQLVSTGLTVMQQHTTETVTQTQTVTQAHVTVERQQVVTNVSDTNKFTWVHVPTTPSGRIKWSSAEFNDLQVVYQVVYELEKVNGINISSGANLDKSLYVAIKQRTRGIGWQELVRDSLRYAIKL